MAITAPPSIPLITDPSTFSTRAQDWVVWQAEQLYPELTSVSLVLGLSLSGTSVTSNTVGIGSKSFTVETGKGFAAGQSIVIARTSAPTNRMFCVVTSYNSGTGALVVTSQAIEGSGTFTDWSISPTLNAVLTLVQIPDGLITTNKIADDQVTFAKMQNIATSKLLGRATAGSGDVEQLGIGSGLALSGTDLTATIASGTAVTATGTSIDFTGIASWVKRITVMFSGVSTNGTSEYICRLGTSGGIATSSYDAMRGSTNSTNPTSTSRRTDAFPLVAAVATSTYQGSFVITKLTSNTWTAAGVISDNTSLISMSSGYAALSGALTQIRITTVNGTDTFDAGSINILYE